MTANVNYLTLEVYIHYFSYMSLLFDFIIFADIHLLQALILY